MAALHGDAFLRNVKDLIKKVIERGEQPLQIRVSPDVLRVYGKEIAATTRPPIVPGAPPSFMGFPLTQDARLPNGSVVMVVSPPSGGRQEINLGKFANGKFKGETIN